ncbi:OLC1v1011816C1 [Oldenlandia corymbosa var. corymbosa]|uniref:OLC1v1011816C1 n=1 Tax=Oldenlandia corymbosa var. corymbosa TaxID=529605 RepID=A0AAV1DXK5_OLDCO|nr:OLC1v1011816C1 [Oldenlandia corymbosa var. corymbosa]
MQDGVTWLMNSPQQALGFILADNGFDVWISNVRGTRYSRRHATLDPNFNPKFWDWSWDELVDHDLPAVLGFVQKQTGQKVHYVGHSLGTLMALATLAEGKQLDKLKSAALLSPIAYLSHMTTALGIVASRSFMGELGQLFGLAEFNPMGPGASALVRFYCSQPLVNCYDFMAAMTGVNCCLNRTTAKDLLEHEPQSTSTKNLVHLAQTVRDGVLRRYNYGNTKDNMAHYKSPNPPVFNLAKIPPSFPLFLSYGGQDALSDIADVKRLLSEIKSHDPAKLQVQLIKDYGHADFILATNAKDLVYNQVISFFRKFN